MPRWLSAADLADRCRHSLTFCCPLSHLTDVAAGQVDGCAFLDKRCYDEAKTLGLGFEEPHRSSPVL